MWLGHTETNQISARFNTAHRVWLKDVRLYAQRGKGCVLNGSLVSAHAHVDLQPQHTQSLLQLNSIHMHVLLQSKHPKSVPWHS